MTQSIEFQEVLDALPDPIFVIATNGIAEFANRAASQLLGGDIVGRPLRPFLAGDVAAQQAFLARCANSQEPLSGIVELRGRSGDGLRLRCLGRAIGTSATRVLLRCSEPGPDMPAGSGLQQSETAWKERGETPIRELQHRLKNNLHMLSAMFEIASKESARPEIGQALRVAGRRVAAIAAAQQALFISEDPQHFSGADLLDLVCKTYARPLASSSRISVEADQASFSPDIAVPLALILDELIANALKHGTRNDPAGRIRTTLARRDGEFELAVEDDGPGFDPPQDGKRASGLGLVRGLARQIGGRFSVERTAGARCVVRFSDQRRSRPSP